MRINNITNGCSEQSQQLRLIYGSYNPLVEAAIVKRKTPLSYLFIQSVADSCVLEQTDYLTSLLRTGLSKLRSALTANSINDLNILLQFMGGENSPQQLQTILNQANTSQQNVLNNPQWWQSLFEAAGIVDEDVKNNIINQVKQNFQQPPQSNQPTTQNTSSGDSTAPQSTDAQADTTSEQNPPSTPSTFRSTVQQAKQSPSAFDIAGQKQQEQAYNDFLSQQLERLQRGRESNRVEIQKLLQAIEAKQQQAHTESVCNQIAAVLLENDTVINHISLVNHILSRKLSILYKQPTYPILEAGAINRLRNAFRSTSNLLANPALMQTAGVQLDNQRAGKLAVQLITNHLRDRFNQTLNAAGLSPEDIITNYQQYAELTKKIQSGSQDPQTVQQYEQIAAKMQQIYQLFGRAVPDTTATQEPPPDALAVAGPSGVESNQTAASDQSSTPASNKTGPLTDDQKLVGKRLLIRMIQVGQDVGLQTYYPHDESLTDEQKNQIYLAMRAAGKSAAAKYAKVDQQVAQAAYNYYVKHLRGLYKQIMQKRMEQIKELPDLSFSQNRQDVSATGEQTEKSGNLYVSDPRTGGFRLQEPV